MPIGGTIIAFSTLIGVGVSGRQILKPQCPDAFEK